MSQRHQALAIDVAHAAREQLDGIEICHVVLNRTVCVFEKAAHDLGELRELEPAIDHIGILVVNVALKDKEALHSFKVEHLALPGLALEISCHVLYLLGR